RLLRATTESYALSLHDALPILQQVGGAMQRDGGLAGSRPALHDEDAAKLRADDAVLLGLNRRDDVGHPPCALRRECGEQRALALDRKSTRLNSSHVKISYAVFC